MTKNSRYILGDSLIDQQHAELLESLNTIHALHDRHLSDENVVDCLTKISSQLYQHFLAEEALMLRVQMPEDEFAAHKNEHLRILEEVAELHFKIMQGNVSWVSDVLHQFSSWVAEHIQGFDAQISHYLVRMDLTDKPSP